MYKSVQVCIKLPWCQEMFNGLSDICSKLKWMCVIECSVTALYGYGCAYQLCFNSAV